MASLSISIFYDKAPIELIKLDTEKKLLDFVSFALLHGETLPPIDREWDVLDNMAVTDRLKHLASDWCEKQNTEHETKLHCSDYETEE